MCIRGLKKKNVHRSSPYKSVVHIGLDNNIFRIANIKSYESIDFVEKFNIDLKSSRGQEF